MSLSTYLIYSGVLTWIHAVSLPGLSVIFCYLETTVKAIEDAFKEFTTREDIAIVLISQYVSSIG